MVEADKSDEKTMGTYSIYKREFGKSYDCRFLVRRERDIGRLHARHQNALLIKVADQCQCFCNELGRSDIVFCK